MDERVGGLQRFQTMKLEIPHFAGRDFHVFAIEGEEAMSKPYRFNVDFTCPDVLDGATATGKPVTLTLETGGRDLIVAGTIVEFRCDDPTPLGDFAYHVVIGPRLTLFDLSRQNQVYGTVHPLAVGDLIGGKLSNSLSRSSTSGGETTAIDFELRLSGSYPHRSNIVQFDESDLNFIGRTCEHLGIFYFFEHRHMKDTVIFGDANIAFSTAADPGESGDAHLSYRLTRGRADDLSVSSFVATSRPVPRKMYVRDFDDMQASTQLLASADVDQGGIGAVVEYGQNFSSLDDGTRLATIRAEERNAEKTVFTGVSTAPMLRPGHYFTLHDHPNKAANGRYVVISARHRAGEARGWTGPYQNTFECIKFDVPYRPKRVTPRPVAAGVFNATIDASGSGERADIDASGRYKIRHVYDESNSPAGYASAFVRKAQPYAGRDDTGFHFPLLKEAEVLIGYINGDPDRPIILGAVPNSVTPAVSRHVNHTINRFRSPSGGLFELHDGHHRERGATGATGATGAQGATGATGPAGTLAGVTDDTTDPDPYFRFVSQDTNTVDVGDSSYFRLGSYISTEESSILPINATDPTLGSIAPAVTSSTVKVETWDTSEEYLNDSLKSSAGKGQLTSAQLQGNTATQNISKAAVTPTARTPLNNGIFMYTDQDYQLNAKGAGYELFQQGHSTVVSRGDSSYNVKSGTYSVTAMNGVIITAGILPSTAETLVTDGSGDQTTAAGLATGEQFTNILQGGTDPTTAGQNAMNPAIQHAKDVAAEGAQSSAGLADLYLYSSNNFNQKAFGPLSEITYGDSYKNVQGNTTDIFSGTYYKETHGQLTQHLYADTNNYYHQNVDTVTLGGTSSVFVGGLFSFKLDVEVNIFVGIKMDINVSAYLKIAALEVAVLGVGVKVAIQDSSFIGSVAYKAAPIDNKNVIFDAKTLVFAVENGAVTAKNKTMAWENQVMYGKMASTLVKQAAFDTAINALIVKV